MNQELKYWRGVPNNDQKEISGVYIYIYIYTIHFKNGIDTSLLNTQQYEVRIVHLARIKHQFLSGIRDSRKTGSLWGLMRGVGGERKLIDQSWLAKRLGLGLLCWGFKGVQQAIHWEEVSTLQIRSVAFPPGQCTSPQLHPCHRLFDQHEHQDISSPSV